MMRIANAPCSWGVLEFDLEGKAAGYAQVLDEMVASGYEGTELGDWGFMPTDPAQLKAELEARKLSLLGAFVPVLLKDRAAHRPGIETALRTARLLAEVQPGNPWLNQPKPFIILSDDNGKDFRRTRFAGRITPQMGMSESDWQAAAQGATTLARAVLDETGLRTVFHHHCGGFIETPAEIEMLLQRTDPALLGLCLDTGHYRFAGGDPLKALRQYAGRVWHIHFKDCQGEIAARSRAEGWDYFQSVREGVFCELGKGEIDFTALRIQLEMSAYQGWIVVEQYVLPGMGSPLESATRNRDYLRTISLI